MLVRSIHDNINNYKTHDKGWHGTTSPLESLPLALLLEERVHTFALQSIGHERRELRGPGSFPAHSARVCR